MNYKNIFKSVLTEDLGEERIPVSPADQDMGDDEIWRQNNPNIVEDEALTGQFDVEGLPADMTAEYVNRISQWRDNLEKVSEKMEEIHNFATENADKPGAGEIFNTIGSGVEDILTNLGTLNGHLRTLGNKIKIATKRENDKGRK